MEKFLLIIKTINLTKERLKFFICMITEKFLLIIKTINLTKECLKFFICIILIILDLMLSINKTTPLAI